MMSNSNSDRKARASLVHKNNTRRQKVSADGEVLAVSVSELTADYDTQNGSKRDTTLTLKGECDRTNLGSSGKRSMKKQPKPSQIGLPKKNLTAYAFFIKHVSPYYIQISINLKFYRSGRSFRAVKIPNWRLPQ